MKPQSFPFGIAFMMRHILHNKMLQQATDLLIEVSPAAVLRAHKEESLPRRHHPVAELPLLVSFPFPGAFVSCF